LGALVDEETLRISEDWIRGGFMKMIDVECANLSKLLSRTSLASPLALVIDAEGHDEVILTQFMVKGGLRPHIVMFEVEHFSSETQERLVTLFMEELGELGDYACARVEQNIVCWRGGGAGASALGSVVPLTFASCWCPAGFGKDPFPKCFGQSKGCRTESNKIVTPEELLGAMAEIYERVGPQVWAAS
jgi:hypothetical protein